LREGRAPGAAEEEEQGDVEGEVEGEVEKAWTFPRGRATHGG
jgi:hypothetical protein